MSSFLTATQTLTILTCGACGVKHAIPENIHDKALKDSDVFWYCPNGHHIHYSKSDNVRLREEVEQLSRDRDWYSKRVESLHNELTHQKHLTRAQKAAKKKIMNRVKNGVCPCCNRTFVNLQNHFKTQHPELIDEKA